MSLRRSLEKFYEFLGQPIFMGSRPILGLLAIPLILSFFLPLWQVHLTAPQYPAGLAMYIYPYKLDGGREGKDIQEINTLNHYIGMRHIDRAELNDLDWIPFAFGAMILLALRVAAVGNVRSLIDLLVITSYVGVFSLGRFYYKLYTFGHELDPRAPFHMEPFTPVLLGTKQVANFTTQSYPAAGTWCVLAFVLGVAGVTAWHLIAGRLAAVRAGRLAPVTA
jgi:hypothetical protein